MSRGPKRRWSATPNSVRRPRNFGTRSSPSGTNAAPSSRCRTRFGACAPQARRRCSAKRRRDTPHSGLNAQQWDDFLLIYKGDVDKSLTAYIAWADGEVAKLNGVSPPPGDPNVPLIADSADLASLPLAPIAAEMLRLEALFSADKLVRDQYAALTARIAQENGALQTLQTRLTDAQGAAARRKQLQTERDDTYGRVFEAIINEQNALAGLYAPLMTRIAASSGTLKKTWLLSSQDCRRRRHGARLRRRNSSTDARPDPSTGAAR